MLITTRTVKISRIVARLSGERKLYLVKQNFGLGEIAMSKKKGECLNADDLRELFCSLKKVNFFGSLKIDNFERRSVPTVYRYMRFSRARQLIDSKSISFANPASWEDPLEKRFLWGNYKDFKPKQLACLCVTTEHGENEAAAWRSFDPDGRHDLVQLTLDFKVLLNALNDFAQKNGAKVYVKAADYRFTSDQINSSGYDSFLKSVSRITDKKYIELMSLKRRAFAFEKELRFFVYGDNLPFEGSYLNIPYEGKLVKTIKVCPKPNVLAFVSAEDVVLDTLKKRYGNEMTIEKSHLYDDISKFNYKRAKK